MESEHEVLQRVHRIDPFHIKMHFEFGVTKLTSREKVSDALGKKKIHKSFLGESGTYLPPPPPPPPPR